MLNDLSNRRQEICDSEDSDPTGRSVEMPQGIDDFTIVLPELTDMAECKLKVYAQRRKWLVRCNQIRRRNWHCPGSDR